jgi:hypothetical protein
MQALEQLRFLVAWEQACCSSHLPQCVGVPVVHHVEAAIHVHTDGAPACMELLG